VESVPHLSGTTFREGGTTVGVLDHLLPTLHPLGLVDTVKTILVVLTVGWFVLVNPHVPTHDGVLTVLIRVTGVRDVTTVTEGVHSLETGGLGTVHPWTVLLKVLLVHVHGHGSSECELRVYPEEQLVVPPTNVDGPVVETFNTL